MTAWYRTGTAAVNNGSADVVGTGTGWNSEVQDGDAITFDGGAKFYEVLSVTDNTHLTLASNFAESNFSGAYAIQRTSPKWSLASELATRLGNYITNLATLFNGLVAFLPETITPSSPSAGLLALYAKASNELYSLDSDGNNRRLPSLTLPTVDNNVPRMDGVTGDMQASGLYIDDSGFMNHMAGFRNRLINPHCAIIQRNDVHPAALTVADNGYWADRWRALGEASLTCYGADVANLAGDTEACGTVQFAADGTSKGGAFQVIERAACVDMRGKTVTFSVRIVKTGGLTMRIAILVWTGASDAVSADPIASWGADGANPTLATNWAFANTPADITPASPSVNYVTAAIGASANNVAVLIWNNDKSYTIGDFFCFTEANLYIGSHPVIATERRPYQVELALCQRYYSKSFGHTVKPAEGINSTWMPGFAWSTTHIGVFLPFPVPMRVSPTMLFYKPALITGTNGKWQWYKDSAGAYQDSSVTAVSNQFNRHSVSIDLTVSGAVVGDAYIVQGNWVADAEL
jgi:hypothetical protein